MKHARHTNAGPVPRHYGEWWKDEWYAEEIVYEPIRKMLRTRQYPDDEIAAIVGVSHKTVERLRVREGFERVDRTA